MRGPPVSELRKRLADFGIATDAVFEKKELLRLLEEAEQRRPPKPQLPAIESMDLQAVMGELEDRGVGFDVLAPEPSLYALLKKTRAKAGQQATAAWAARVATPPPARAPVAPPPSAPPPSSSSAAAGAQERRTTRGASPHRDLGSFAVDAVSTTVGVAKATAENLAPKVGGVIDQLGVVPAAAAAASSPKAKRVRDAVKALRTRLKGVKPPSKPVLLLLCVGALRYGLTRTALAAAAAKLTLEIAQDVIPPRFRGGGPRRTIDAEVVDE